MYAGSPVLLACMTYGMIIRAQRRILGPVRYSSTTLRTIQWRVIYAAKTQELEILHPHDTVRHTSQLSCRANVAQNTCSYHWRKEWIEAKII